MPKIELTTREVKVLNTYLNKAIDRIKPEVILSGERFMLERVKAKLKGKPNGKLRRRRSK